MDQRIRVFKKITITKTTYIVCKMSNLRTGFSMGEEGRVGSREEGEDKIDLTSDSLVGGGGIVKTKQNPL